MKIVKNHLEKKRGQAKDLDIAFTKKFIDDYNQTIIVPLKEDVKRLSKEVSVLKDAINMQRYCKFDGPCVILKKMDKVE